MTDLDIIETLLHDERFEDTVLVTDKHIKAEVKTTTFKPDFLEMLRKMDTPYRINGTQVKITRKSDQELPDGFSIMEADDEEESLELLSEKEQEELLTSNV